MKTSAALGVALVCVALLSFGWIVTASDAEMCFSTDKNGQNRVTNIQEGESIFIVVFDPDENQDCDVRDKFTTDVKIMDPKTGAYIMWNRDDPFDPVHPTGDYFEETGADTGLFVSNRSFQVGTRELYNTTTVLWTMGDYGGWAHVVDANGTDFQWGNYTYDGDEDAGNVSGDNRGYFVSGVDKWYFQRWIDNQIECGNQDPYTLLPHDENWLGDEYLIGRFENNDTLVGMYQDRNDPTDVAIAMMKIIDIEATIVWDQQIYKDANSAATITVVDPDENLDCSRVEYVPIFILVNPGSWNQTGSATVNSFCSLIETGGWQARRHDPIAPADYQIRWFNIYEDRSIWYPSLADDAGLYKTLFDVEQNVVPVAFFAQETSSSSGVFQLNLNSILTDLEFNSLKVRDVLAAYYLDPNDFDDFKLATAYIEERRHSITSFADAIRANKDVFWIGRDSVYVQVIDSNANVDPCCPEQVVVHVCDPHAEDDAEWLILDETSSNSPVFFSFAGMSLLPVWDPLGVGLHGYMGGYQLRLDNWKLEVFNEDDVYARYNDVAYVLGGPGLGGLGDQDNATAFPPQIDRVRVPNDVSFDTMSIADTQVFDGAAVNMHFLNRQGDRVSGYVNSDCVFIEVIDPDQDEDQYRRERVDAYWDGGQNVPFGPVATEPFACDHAPYDFDRCVNNLLGRVSIFDDIPADSLAQDSTPLDNGVSVEHAGWAKVYVLNPRSGMWAALDLLETGVSTGVFVSVICVDLTSVYSECVPTLGVLPGDTIIAVYQDPTNHSDSAWISTKVGIGGGGTPPGQQSTTMFVDAEGNEVANYNSGDTVYVKVIDPSHAGATLLASAVEIGGVDYDLSAADVADTFMTAGLDLGLTVGDDVTATYTDPTDLTDTSADTITVIASELVVDSFYAGPNPFETEVTFGFNGTGVASVMTVAVYDLAGGLLWETAQTDVSEITWDGVGAANGAYIYVITATDGTNTFDGTGKVFVNR
ncbi:hypothetical protein ACFLSZ_03040 [Candidatus Bipolaricaulota bacterium]